MLHSVHSHRDTARAICYRPSFIWYIIQMPFLYKHIGMSDRAVLLWLDPEHWQTNPHVDKILSVWTRQLPQWRKLLNKSITSLSNMFKKGQLFAVFRLLNQQSASALRTNLLPGKKSNMSMGKVPGGWMFTQHIDRTRGLYIDSWWIIQVNE